MMARRPYVMGAVLLLTALAGCVVEQEDASTALPTDKTYYAASATVDTCTKDAFVQADPGAGFLTMKPDGSVWKATAHHPASRIVSLGNDNKKFADNSGQAIDYCVIKNDDSLWCWGPNQDGVVGLGTQQEMVTEPTKILEDVAEAEMARYWACARKNDGTVWCWGNVLETGILGDGQTYPIGPIENPDGARPQTPKQVTLPGPAKQLATGFSHSFAVLEDGRVFGWGAGAGYCLGLGNDSEARVSPVEITQLGTDNKYLSAGSFSGIVLKNDGRVFTWAYASGKGGPPTEPISEYFEVTTVGRNGVIVEARMHQDCVITSDGHFWCWGDENPDNQLANGSTNPEDRVLTPELFAGGMFEGGSPVKEMRLAKSHSCVILEDQSLWCVGVGGFADGAWTDNEPLLQPVEQDWCNTCDVLTCEFTCEMGECVMCTSDDQCLQTPATPFCNGRTGKCQDVDPGNDTNERVSGCGGGARCTAAAGRGPARFGAWTILLAAFVGLGAFRRVRRIRRR